MKKHNKKNKNKQKFQIIKINISKVLINFQKT